MIKDKSHKEKGNNVNVVIDHRIAKFTMNMHNLMIDVVLFIFEEAVPEKVKNANGYNQLSEWQKQLADVVQTKGGLKAICKRCFQMGKTMRFFVVFVNQILDFVLASANQHNGVLTRTKLN
eukprot:442759_1